MQCIAKFCQVALQCDPWVSSVCDLV